MLQLLVYAGLQVPVGVSVDRLGPRRLIATGALVMAGGQVLLAVSHQLPLALLARALVGAGDAMTFVSVLRLVNAWFPPRRIPLVTQLTGMIGQTGQLLSAVPLAALLRLHGWTPDLPVPRVAGGLRGGDSPSSRCATPLDRRSR